MKKLGLIGGILLSTALLVSSTGAILAAEGESTTTPMVVTQSEPRYQGFVGTVAAGSDIAGGVITLQTKNLGEVEILLNDDASHNDIEEGSRLAILATVGEDDSYTAVRVMVVPAVATRQHINGVIVSVQDRAMTIINAAGEPVPVDLPEGVKGGEIGDLVTAAVRKPSGGGNPEVSGIQTAAEVQARIQAHLNEVAGRQAQTQAEIQQREQVMTQLCEMLEGLALRHREMLQGVLEEAPVTAREAIQRALNNAEQGIQLAIQTINQVKASLGEQLQQQQSGQPTTSSGQQSTGPSSQGN